MIVCEDVNISKPEKLNQNGLQKSNKNEYSTILFLYKHEIKIQPRPENHPKEHKNIDLKIRMFKNIKTIMKGITIA